MSFMKTLASVAVGFAAAKGMEKYKQMGGMAGLQDMMKGAGQNPAADQIGQMADRLGVPGGSDMVKNFINQMTGAGAGSAGAAGLGGLMNAMQGAAQSGGQQSADMMEAMFGGTPMGAAMEEQAKLMLRAMIQAAKVDGNIDAEEKAAILDKLGDDISAEERAFVQAELESPVDVMGLAADSGNAMKAQIYAVSLAAIRVDNVKEAAYLDQLATALGLNDQTRDHIHAHMGVPPLRR